MINYLCLKMFNIGVRYINGIGRRLNSLNWYWYLYGIIFLVGFFEFVGSF